MRSDRRLRLGHKIKVQGVKATGAVGPVFVVLGSGDPAPPVPSYIGYNPATDVLVKEDSMQYATDTAFTAKWHKLRYPQPGQIANISGVTVTLDPAASTRPGYPIGLKVFLPSAQAAITAGTWPVGTGDYEAGCEGGMFMNPATAMSDAAVGGQPGYQFWWSYRMRFTPGFRWSAFDPTTLTPNDPRMFNYKQWLIYREPFGGSQGRYTFSPIPESGTEQNGSSANGDFLPGPSENWVISSGTDTAASAGHQGAYRYVSTMNNALHGVDRSPLAIGTEGGEHEFVFTARNEMVSGNGDGLFGLWVDNYPVIYCDGADPTDVVYHRVYSRVRQWMTSQWQPIVNGGSIQDQTNWLLGPIRAWTRP